MNAISAGISSVLTGSLTPGEFSRRSPSHVARAYHFLWPMTETGQCGTCSDLPLLLPNKPLSGAPGLLSVTFAHGASRPSCARFQPPVAPQNVTAGSQHPLLWLFAQSFWAGACAGVGRGSRLWKKDGKGGSVICNGVLSYNVGKRTLCSIAGCAVLAFFHAI